MGRSNEGFSCPSLTVDNAITCTDLIVKRRASVDGQPVVPGEGPGGSLQLEAIVVGEVDAASVDARAVSAETVSVDQLDASRINTELVESKRLVGPVEGNLTGDTEGTHTGPVVGDVLGSVDASGGKVRLPRFDVREAPPAEPGLLGICVDGMSGKPCLAFSYEGEWLCAADGEALDDELEEN